MPDKTTTSVPERVRFGDYVYVFAGDHERALSHEREAAEKARAAGRTINDELRRMMGAYERAESDLATLQARVSGVEDEMERRANAEEAIQTTDRQGWKDALELLRAAPSTEAGREEAVCRRCGMNRTEYERCYEGKPHAWPTQPIPPEVDENPFPKLTAAQDARNWERRAKAAEGALKAQGWGFDAAEENDRLRAAQPVSEDSGDGGEAEQWVNAVAEITVALDVPVDAPKIDKMEAVERAFEWIAEAPGAGFDVVVSRFEDVEDGEPLSPQSLPDEGLSDLARWVQRQLAAQRRLKADGTFSDFYDGCIGALETVAEQIEAALSAAGDGK